jgi:hypothetical protein
VIWANDGTIGHADPVRCVELLGREVLPAGREIADELERPGPFEAGLTVSRPEARPAARRTAMPVV